MYKEEIHCKMANVNPTVSKIKLHIGNLNSQLKDKKCQVGYKTLVSNYMLPVRNPLK